MLVIWMFGAKKRWRDRGGRGEGGGGRGKWKKGEGRREEKARGGDLRQEGWWELRVSGRRRRPAWCIFCNGIFILMM
jgi:hypothetical protein